MKSYSNKTVLITGATGLIGSHIVDALMDKGDVKVIALSRSEEKLKKGFEQYLKNSNFSVVAKDVVETFKFHESIDYIFHAAGPMEGKIIKNRPIDVIKPNIAGTMNCLEFLKKQEIEKGIKGRMVLFSSVTVYGNNADVDLIVQEADTRVTETLESVSAPYSQSKRMSEVITLAYCRQFGIDAVIGRFSTVYGSTRFIPDTAFYNFIKKGIDGENITLNSSGLPRRDNIYVDDAVAGILAVGTKGITGEAYNVSSNGELGNYASVDEIAQVIAEAANKRNSDIIVEVINKLEATGVRRPGLKLDNSKLKKLGWDISTSLTEGIDKTINDIVKQ
ncbi:MAG: NAD-dependent epimerase/dehydratase family protein [Velocimicrobium sp.]